MSQNWIKVADASDVPEDGTLLVNLGAEPVCLYNLGGKIFATHDTCTHGQASLADGFIEGEEIECPLHQGKFHIATGKAVGAPCTEDIRTYAVKIENGNAEQAAISTLQAQGALHIEKADGQWRDGKWIDFDPVSVPVIVDSPAGAVGHSDKRKEDEL